MRTSYTEFIRREDRAHKVFEKIKNKEEVNRWTIFALRDFLKPMTKGTEFQQQVEEAIESARESL